MPTPHRTYLRQLDPDGLHWLLLCEDCTWRVVINDDVVANDRNYVALSQEHTIHGSDDAPRNPGD